MFFISIYTSVCTLIFKSADLFYLINNLSKLCTRLADDTLRHISLVAWREFGEETDETMTEDLLSKQEAKAPFWLYVRFKQRT